ncbi:hypothetical protein RHSIM_Rhsim05G0138200 [Rhododendron simsii]|uniref:Uncharacterized protein n=1 Tax=Rhododendron simsii TaxID=118357 RepID=A0A834H005_RHOSS|nr:hypothetical protein RHSIM_Rhsim05G0138200 [Rhododendron simsii]
MAKFGTCTIRRICVSLKTSDEKIVRRSANYQPPMWDYDYVQSLDNKYVHEKGNKDILHATSLKFRLLRQHGYNIPQGTSNGALKQLTKKI